MDIKNNKGNPPRNQSHKTNQGKRMEGGKTKKDKGADQLVILNLLRKALPEGDPYYKTPEACRELAAIHQKCFSL